MNEIKRYDIIKNVYGNIIQQENKSGKYVKYRDIEHLLTVKKVVPSNVYSSFTEKIEENKNRFNSFHCQECYGYQASYETDTCTGYDKCGHIVRTCTIDVYTRNRIKEDSTNIIIAKNKNKTITKSKDKALLKDVSS